MISVNTLTELIAIHRPNAKTILFYTHIPRAFKTTLIGYLFDVCQTYSTILLSEELDKKILALLEDKTLFPKLEKIIPIQGFTDFKVNPFKKTKRLYTLAKSILTTYNPDLVISPYDIYAPFEWYLIRATAKMEIPRIYPQPSLIGKKSKNILINDLANAEVKFPHWLPRKIRFLLAKIRRNLKDFLFFFILPFSIMEKPLKKEVTKPKKSKIHAKALWTTWTVQNYNNLTEDGIPIKNLYILPHPLTQTKTKWFFNLFFNKFNTIDSYQKHNTKSVTLILSGDLPFKRKGRKPITQDDRLRQLRETVQTIQAVLPQWRIYIKPHPYLAEAKYSKQLSAIQNTFEPIADTLQVINPSDPIENYIETSDIIIGLPPSSSTALFTASVQCPTKLIISLNNYDDLCGDFYKDYPGILYIDDLQKLKNILYDQSKHDATT